MNERQRRFVDHFLTHGIAERAAVEAGYSERRAKVTGSELLKRPDVAAAIRKAQDDRAERLGISADWVVQQAVEIVEQARRGVVRTNRGEVVYDDEGQVVMDPQLAAAVSSLNTLAKVLGLGQPQRVEHDHSGEVVYTLRVDQRPPALEIGEAE